MDKVKLEARRIARQEQKRVSEIDRQKNQNPVKELTITIEWVKSKMWGYNPNAEVKVEFHNKTFERKNGYRASGCGYDKESTVIAAIFNDFLLYKLWREPRPFEGWLNGKKTDKPYGVSWGKDYRGYAGGVGTNCYFRISEFIGGKFEKVASGRTFDVYRYTDI
jgi:hypothetical protein